MFKPTLEHIEKLVGISEASDVLGQIKSKLESKYKGAQFKKAKFTLTTKMIEVLDKNGNMIDEKKVPSLAFFTGSMPKGRIEHTPIKFYISYDEAESAIELTDGFVQNVFGTSDQEIKKLLETIDTEIQTALKE